MVLLVGCGGTAESADSSGPPRATRQPDIVLLSIDTLRADHLGAYGYERDTSPFVDQLAANGTRFADAWAPSPWTLPSHATMLSGLLPFQHGAIEEQFAIGEDAPMLAEHLGIGGYRTGAVVTALYTSRKFGFERGFDFYHDFGVVKGWGKRRAPRAQEVFEQALTWGQKIRTEKPVFLFLHVYDVHWPYAAPSPWDEKFDRVSRGNEMRYKNYKHYIDNPPSSDLMEHQVNQYDEEIAYVDDAFAQFHATWTAIRPETVFVIVSDHGEEFLERGSWGHAHTLYPEQLQVPWIVSGIGIRKQIIDERVGLEDLASTLASLANVTFPVGDGVNRGDQLRTGSSPSLPEGHVPGRFASTSRHETLLHRWHKPTWDLHHDLSNHRFSLFDLENDPKSRNNRIDESRGFGRSKRARRMSEDMYAWLGQPWAVAQAGSLLTDGVFVTYGNRQESRIVAPEGLRFAVYPLDASVTWISEDGSKRDTFRAHAGNTPAPDHPGLRWLGAELANQASELTEEQREQLRALGYIN